jgi:Tfp pilus assembly protein PilV
MKRRREKNFGFSLLEVAFAIGVISIGMMGVSSLVIVNIQAENINRNNLTASMLAQEGLELVRNKRDINWLTPGNDWKLGAGAGTNSDIYQDGSYIIDHTGAINAAVNSINDAGAKLYLNGDFYEHNPSGASTLFSRLIQVTDHTDWVEVTALVRWQAHNKYYDYQALTYLYNWR